MSEEVNKDCTYVFKGSDLTHLKEITPSTTEFGKVLSCFIGHKEAEVSLTPTIVMPLLNKDKRQYKVRTLLDSGSMTNWIAKELLNVISYTIKGHTTLEVYTMTGKVLKKFQLVEVYYTYDNKDFNIACYVHDTFTQHITVKGLPKYIKENSAVSPRLLDNLSDPATNELDHGGISKGIGLILCTAATNELRINKVIHLKGLGILLEPTIFGIAVSGRVPEALRGNVNTVCAYNIVPRVVSRAKEPLFKIESDEEEVLKKNLKFLSNQESLGISDKEVHGDDKIAWEHFVSTTKRIGNDQFEVRMPFNEKVHQLKSNIKKAAGRTRSEQVEMNNSPTYMQAMCKAHQTFVDRDSVEVVDTSILPKGPVYYMPFRGIVKAGSKTTECRICMDASSKPSASDVSLNQVLYQGPNMVLNLALLLLKFMKGKYGAIADLEKAFLRIVIALEDRDVLRYFWFSDPNDMFSPLIVMRFKVVIFGSKASPFQLAAVIHVLIRDDCHDRAVKLALENCIYVDNIVHAEDVEEDLVKFYEISRELFKKGNFNIRQWASNSTKVMEKARKENVAEQDSLIKVLGMFWDIDRDRYLFCCALEWNGEFTKRSALAFSCKVFDPLGILAPITTRNKVFLQVLWGFMLKWDESFEFLENGELKDKWLHLVREVHVAMKCQFERRTVSYNQYEVHIFSDASQDSYGAVTYVRTLPCTDYPDGKVSLVTAKGKVAPLKGNRTIPKLELAAVVVAAHQGKFLQRAWDIPKGVKYFLWIDAKVVLRWLTQYNIKETFVHNRVKQIRELVCKENTTIRYVPSGLNPADLITKEQDALKFSTNKDWFEGPGFLSNEEDWPEEEDKYNLFPEGCDQKISLYKITVKETKKTSPLTFFMNRKFTSSLRVLAIILKVARGKTFSAHKKDHILSKEELDQAKTKGIMLMQEEMFPEELKSLRSNKKVTTVNRKLNLYLDKGVIKCRGRLGNLLGDQADRNPMLVNGGHPFVRSLVRHYHVHYNCSSKRYTLHKVRKVLHGPNLNKAVKTMCRECYLCKLLRARPYAYPGTPPLPEERLIVKAPFAVCGVDYSGPYKVKRGRGTEKVWIVLYTCMVSRAIYLHIVPDLTAESFLNSLRVLTMQYRQPRVIMSDNATCFTAAEKVLKELSEQFLVKTELSALGIKWLFTPTNAPWMGACYERLIGVLKRELEKMLGGTRLSYFELDLHLRQITGIINNRPLTSVGTDEVITPNNILTGSNNTDDNILEVAETEELLKQAMVAKDLVPQLFVETEKLREIFWKRFREQYLEAIKFENKATENKPGLLPQVGDVVIVFSKTNKLFWNKGLVLELIKSHDGLVRKARVKINKIETIKALNHLYPLEARAEEAIEKYQKDKAINNSGFEGFEQEEQVKNRKRIEALRQAMATSVPEDSDSD